jgi:eukaryotic-like serine/threonine-protein kinase
MKLAPGQQVTSDLTLVRSLRRGAMGSVWVAHHASRRERVAVKFLAENAGHDGQMLARFRREAAAVAQLANPNVVRIVDHGTTHDGTPYLAMELLEGESLGERLERVGRLPMMVASHILRSVGNALDAAHSRGIIHRDIKPDNVFLLGADVPTVKVLDFGMAKQVRRDDDGEVTATGVAVGTPEYMSPEQVLGGKDVDHRSDLWALGALTFRMLTGQTPFGGDTPHALFFNICNGAFPPLHEVGLPLELEPWFRRVFAPNKIKRFGSAREMVLRFEALLRDLGESSPGVSVERLGGSFDDESTQLVDAERILAGAPRSIDDEPSTTRSGAAALVEGDELSHTHDLSALRLGDLDLLDHDEQPTFQLSPAEAAALNAAADARLEDASPLPLLRPVDLEPSASGAVLRPSRPSSPEAPPSAPSFPDASASDEAPGATAKAEGSDPEALPLEIPGSAPPPPLREAFDSMPPPSGSNAWKVGLAAGVLVAGLAAAMIVREGAGGDEITSPEPRTPVVDARATAETEAKAENVAPREGEVAAEPEAPLPSNGPEPPAPRPVAPVTAYQPKPAPLPARPPPPPVVVPAPEPAAEPSSEPTNPEAPPSEPPPAPAPEPPSEPPSGDPAG